MPSKSMAELEELVGQSQQVVEDFEIEAGKVEEFARAIGDDNPAHRSSNAARSQGFERVPAPLTFTRVAYFPRYRPDGVDGIRPFDLGFDPERRLHGEQAYEFERPVRVGDVLSATVTLVDVYQREGSGGTLSFAEFELEYFDANGELVLTERNSVIEAPSPEEAAE
ncbi:MAG: MaoC family dehydratase N-terminal domain-containing protein [Salinirussus sp.]